MTRLRVLRVAAAFALTATAATALAMSPASGAASLPFTDRHVQGALGFCDRAGHEVRSGSTATAPFTWLAVSTAAAPAGFAHGKATLYGFQPVLGVDPGDWSGSQLSGSSTFSNASHPMTAGTVLDPALEDLTGAYPSKVQGLYELRMYFSAPVKGQFRTSYPAAVVKVSGSTWTLVQGGGVPCTAGTAQSSETLALPKSAFATPQRPVPAADIRKPSHTASTAPKASASSSASTAANSSSGAGATDAASNHHAGKGSGGGISPLVWIPTGLAVVAGAVLAVIRWRRTNPS